MIKDLEKKGLIQVHEIEEPEGSDEYVKYISWNYQNNDTKNENREPVLASQTSSTSQEKNEQEKPKLTSKPATPQSPTEKQHVNPNEAELLEKLLEASPNTEDMTILLNGWTVGKLKTFALNELNTKLKGSMRKAEITNKIIKLVNKMKNGEDITTEDEPTETTPTHPKRLNLKSKSQQRHQKKTSFQIQKQGVNQA